MGLDGRGDVAIVQLIVYAPILLISQFLLFKYGSKKQHGWLFLALFAAARIVGSIFLILKETESDPSTSIIVAAIVLQSVGLSPLILAYTGFIHTVGTDAKIWITKLPYSIQAHIVLIAGVATGAVAGADSTTPGEEGKVATMRKVSAVLFFVTFLGLVGVHGIMLVNKRAMRKDKRMLLIGITSAVPFLFLRFIYTLGSAFEPSQTNTFNLLTGPVSIFVIFSVLPEFFTAIIYVVAGAMQLRDGDGVGDKEKGKGRETGSLGSGEKVNGNAISDMERGDGDPDVVRERVEFE